MKVFITNAGLMNKEYKNALQDVNWSNIQQGDILHTSTSSSYPIKDLVVRMKKKSYVVLEVTSEIQNCKCRHCHELAELF
jgi:hypothetical protein